MRPSGTSRDKLRRVLAATVGALALMAAAPAASPAADEAAWLFDPDAIVEIDFGGLSPAEIDLLEADPDEYQAGTFELRVDGVPQGPPLGEVGIRLKGGMGSFRPLTEKAAFKVKFDEYVDDQTFFGLERLTLNNMVQDPSMTHETLTYELFQSLDLPASRTGYAFLRLNGEPFGVYLNVETLDEISLPRWFASTGHLYEADKPGLDLAPGSEGEFEVDEGDDEDLADLESLIAAANSGVGDWSDGMAAVADLVQMTRMWAVERYVGHWDGYAGVEDEFRPNNYYLHSDDAGLFTMLPWGTDQTWEQTVEFDEEAGGRLFNSCLDDASCEALYVDALGEVQSAVATLGLDAHAAELAEMLAPCQELEIEPRREYTAEEIEQGVEDARGLIAERPAELADFLGSANPPVEPQPGTPGPGPCSPAPPQQPGPGEQVSTPPGQGQLPGPAPSLGKFELGPTRVDGGLVSTSAVLPVAGQVTQRVMAKVRRGWRTACVGLASRDGAGPLTVRCRLSQGFRRQLGLAPLPLKIRIGFKPRSGKPSFRTRSLKAPKQASG